MSPMTNPTTVNFIDLYVKIVEHSLDALEPLILPEDKKNAPIRVQIGRSQNASDFQDVPLTVKVSDALAVFGVYVNGRQIHLSIMYWDLIFNYSERGTSNHAPPKK